MKWNVQWCRKRRIGKDSTTSFQEALRRLEQEYGRDPGEITDSQIALEFDSQTSEPHYRLLRELIQKQEIVPFLGAGASLSAKTEGAEHYAPTAKELAQTIARESGLPAWSLADSQNLSRVASYYKLTYDYGADDGGGSDNSGTLRGLLATRFANCGEPGKIHDFLARNARNFPVIVTTNYDNLIEKAYEKLNVPFIKVVHIATDYENKASVYFDVFKKRSDGNFSGNPQKTPVDTSELEGMCKREQEEREAPLSIVYKMHGSVEFGQFVITEEDYVRFLAGVNGHPPIFPEFLAKRFARSRFLFLGYSLEDWNFRVILESLKKFTRYRESPTRAAVVQGGAKLGQLLNIQPVDTPPVGGPDALASDASHGAPLTNLHWAIQRSPAKLDQTIWSIRRVEVSNIDINAFVEELNM